MGRVKEQLIDIEESRSEILRKSQVDTMKQKVAIETLEDWITSELQSTSNTQEKDLDLWEAKCILASLRKYL